MALANLILLSLVLMSLGAQVPALTSRAPLALSAAAYPPEQIRFAYGNDAYTMVVAWATSNETATDYSPSVQFGASPTLPLTYSAQGMTDGYVAWDIVSPALHFANMSGLQAGGVTYYYRVGCESYGWSPVYTFQSALLAGSWPAQDLPFSVAVTGDMGIEYSNATMTRIGTLAEAGLLHFSIHNGDLAYADNRQSLNNGSLADGILNDFYRMLGADGSYGKRIPVMFGVGNHEMQLGDIPTCINGSAMCKGLAYVKRVGPTLPFAASGSTVPFWYSYEVGPVHFLSLSMEQAWQATTTQHAWAVADIASINRARTPWVVAYVHRPVYCSNNLTWPNWNEFRSTYEPLFVGSTGGSHGGPPAVDVVLTAHVHCYERLWQVADNGTSVTTNYNGLTTPFYLMSGSAGCIEGSTPWIDPQPAWSAYRACEDVAFGFAVLDFHNSSHMKSTFVNAATGQEVDSAWVVRQS